MDRRQDKGVQERFGAIKKQVAMEDKIKELLLKYWKAHWNKDEVPYCVKELMSRILKGIDSFTIALYLRSDWNIDPDYDLVSGIEKIKVEFLNK